MLAKENSENAEKYKKGKKNWPLVLPSREFSNITVLLGFASCIWKFYYRMHVHCGLLYLDELSSYKMCLCPWYYLFWSLLFWLECSSSSVFPPWIVYMIYLLLSFYFEPASANFKWMSHRQHIVEFYIFV